MATYTKQMKKGKQKKGKNNPKVVILEKNKFSNEQETIDSSETTETIDQNHDDGEEYDRKENKAHHHIRVISNSMDDIRYVIM